MGDKKLPGIACGDIGKCAYAIFRKDREFIGKTVGIAGDHLTGGQMAAALSKALGLEIRYNAVSPELYRGLGFPGAEDLGNMFQFKRDFESYFCGARRLNSPGRSTRRCGRSRPGSPKTGERSRSRSDPGGHRESDPAGGSPEGQGWKRARSPAEATGLFIARRTRA